MSPSPTDLPETRRGLLELARMPTGAKLFLILSAALLPLALIAIFAAAQTSHVADAEIASRLRLAANEGARALGTVLVGDITALRVALNELDEDAADAPDCARVQAVFADELARGARFIVMDSSGRSLCGNASMITISVDVPKPSGPVTSAISPTQGLVLAIRSPSGRLTARALFPISLLAEVARPAGFTLPFAAMLIRDRQRLTLQDLSDGNALDRLESITLPLAIAGLRFEMTARRAPLSSAQLLSMLLPLMMWGAAASIGWFVVDRMLIRPLRALQRRVAAYTPGTIIDIGEPRTIPAQEILDLGETFQTISRTVVEHETNLAEGLVRQTRLTREVHHRVKNNLQVISSLINFHARGAKSPEATAAYTSIQRRVDALAVVHRNNFAELEENRGLSLRSVIGDLASNIRATAPSNAGLAISLDLDSCLSTQDVATAIAFLITEIVELAMTVQPDAVVRISLKSVVDDEGRAVLRISSPALIGTDGLEAVLEERYGRVMEGLSRQLRAKLHHDSLVGAYEIQVAITACD